jgi:hypothetical protein
MARAGPGRHLESTRVPDWTVGIAELRSWLRKAFRAFRASDLGASVGEPPERGPAGVLRKVRAFGRSSACLDADGAARRAPFRRSVPSAVRASPPAKPLCDNRLASK